MTFQAPRGTLDILPEDQKYWRYVEHHASEVAARFGFQRIDTPVFEDAELFERGVGNTTDIVEKETYTFVDRGGDRVTLRPEGTAPVCRAYIQHGLQNLPQPVRLFYIWTGFRYERPQAGRYRQFNQFGIEIIGDPNANVDAEVIEVAWRFLEEVGLTDLTLTVNSIGDDQCRPAYMTELESFYEGHKEQICDDCKRRLVRNPLRLLDCKNDQCQPFIADAPQSAQHLCDECSAHWDALKAYLEGIGLEFTIEHRLVRGLDYYARTVFEITPPVEGRTATIVGGGRYDGLIEELGGKPTPGVGYGMGMERVIENLKRQEVPVPDPERTKVLVAHMGDPAKAEAALLASQLRRAGVASLMGPSRGLRSQLRYANSSNCTHAVIIGDDEIAKGVVTVRDLRQSEQNEVPMNELVASFSG